MESNRAAIRKDTKKHKLALADDQNSQMEARGDSPRQVGARPLQTCFNSVFFGPFFNILSNSRCGSSKEPPDSNKLPDCNFISVESSVFGCD